MIDITKIIDELGVSNSSSNHHSREGWIQFCCPYCGDTSYHLGYNIEGQYFHCYRCGWHPFWETLEKLTGISKYHIKLRFSGQHIKPKPETTKRNSVISLSLPPTIKKVEQSHAKYLLSRKINLNAVSVFNLLGTDKWAGKYRNRIILPIFANKQMVNWIGRDITGKSPYRYLNCPNNQAPMPLKHTLYGSWLIQPGSDIIIVEGAFDVLRLGIGAVATFGATYTNEQIQILKNYRHKYIMYDMDDAGQNAAKKLANELSRFEGNVEIIYYNAKDAAELTEHEANQIKYELLRRKCYEN